jgi:transaldolase
MNPLQELSKYGQSVWLDYIRRSLVTSGELQRLIKEDGLGGLTSNPAIFEKAITGSSDYTEALVKLQERPELDAMGLYEELAIKDIQDVADALRTVYDATKRRDGYVSLEVSPFLAKDTQGTIEEGKRLWKAVGRENLMIKVPATEEGVPAIQALLSVGINFNVTLLFSRDIYKRVAATYIAGFE